MGSFEYIARFDGACWPNPGGHAACACVITRGTDEVHREAIYLGVGAEQTNNVSEFAGLLLVLKWLKANAPEASTQIVSDSTIVVNRMKSRTLPKGVCRAKANECLTMLSSVPNLCFLWQPREHNSECDGMCEAALRKEGVLVAQGHPVPFRSASAHTGIPPKPYWTALEERIARLEAELRLREKNTVVCV
jgi:ribonuclease HI